MSAGETVKLRPLLRLASQRLILFVADSRTPIKQDNVHMIAIVPTEGSGPIRPNRLTKSLIPALSLVMCLLSPIGLLLASIPLILELII